MVNSGNDRQSPSSSQNLKFAKEHALTAPPNTNSDTDHDDDDDDDDDYDDVSTESQTLGKVRDDSGTDGSRLKYRPESAGQDTSKSSKLPKAATCGLIITCIGVVVVAVLIAVIFGSSYFHTPQETQKELPGLTIELSETEDEKSLRKDIERIRETFPSQLENTWLAFSAGIKEAARGNPTKPSTFMLLYDTEEGTSICLAQKVGSISTHFLNASKLHPLLIIEGADLEHNETLAEDYGILLDEYRPKVEEQRTMIINNLHKIPGTVAQSFHSFCDVVTPAVNKAVYFFTLKASGVTSNRENPTEVAEEELRKLWGDKMDEDILNPLITRITDTTMIIKPEKNLTSCGS
jgi:hypothetical protein